MVPFEEICSRNLSFDCGYKKNSTYHFVGIITANKFWKNIFYNEFLVFFAEIYYNFKAKFWWNFEKIYKFGPLCRFFSPKIWDNSDAGYFPFQPRRSATLSGLKNFMIFAIETKIARIFLKPES